MKAGCRVHVLTVSVFAVLCMVLSMSGAVCIAQDKVVTLRYSDQFPAGDVHSILGQEYCKEVEKRTNGKVKIRYYAASTLNAPPQMYESITQGVVDMGNHVAGYTKGRFPLMSALSDCPFEYPNGYTATMAANAAYAKFKPKEFDDVKVMYFHMTPEAMLHTVKKPVKKVEDLRGMKVRCMDGNAQIISSLGAAPVGMPQGDTYDALSKGIIGGVSAVYSGLKTWKTADILKYSTEIKGTAYTALFVVAMNKNKWNSIAPEQQKIIEEVNREFAEKQGRQWDTIEKEGKEYCISKGMKITKLPQEEQAKWSAKAKVLYDEYAKKMKERNLPGNEMLNYVRDYLKKGK